MSDNFLDLYKSAYSESEYIEKLDELLSVDDNRRKQYWREVFPELYSMLLE